MYVYFGGSIIHDNRHIIASEHLLLLARIYTFYRVLMFEDWLIVESFPSIQRTYVLGPSQLEAKSRGRTFSHQIFACTGPLRPFWSSDQHKRRRSQPSLWAGYGPPSWRRPTMTG